MPDELSLSLRARVALEAHGFHFTHSLGQNFLLDDHAVAEIVARAGVKAGDHILEIGPGAGLLTAMMADAGADVLAVELGEGCSVGSMSLVNRSAEPWGVYVGIPARRVKERSRKLLEYCAEFESQL